MSYAQGCYHTLNRADVCSQWLVLDVIFAFQLHHIFNGIIQRRDE